MSKRFVPPKLDMGPDFATAGNVKAKHKNKEHKPQVSGGATPGGSKRKGVKKQGADTIPLTINNLAIYFDWRRAYFDQSPTLYKIACTIWLYLEKTPMVEYSINFELATENTVLERASINSAPCLVTTSPKGEILIMVENMKKLPEYSEKQFLLILYPSLADVRFFGDCQVKTSNGDHCTYWEIEGVEHLTHIAMDKHGVIYFTTGESVFRIVKTEGDLYLDTFEDIFTPSNDTSHITCLWRQNNEIFLTIQDWDTEENLDVYKIKPASNRGVSTPESPLSGKGVRSPSFDGNKRKRTRTRSGSGYGSDYGGASPRGRGTANDSNEFVSKVRTFSLSYNSRIWQLGSMNFQKKFVLAVGAAQKAYQPELLKIGFKQKIKTFPLSGKGKGNKNVVWPKTSGDQIPHSIYLHKATKSWFCILPVTNQKTDKLYWIQFKFDKPKKKIIWQRLVEMPEEAIGGDWLYYDEIRDVLVGYSNLDHEKKEYVLKYLPDITRYLWIEEDADDQKNSEPIMQRMVRSRRKSKEKPSLENRRSSGRPTTPKLNNHTSNEHNIKPSKAAKTSNTDAQPVEREKTKRQKKKNRPQSPRPSSPRPKKPSSPRPKKPSSPRPKKSTSPRSSLKKATSPRKKAISTEKKRVSKKVVPKKRDATPKKKQSSPKKREASPKKRDPSPKKGDPSPKKRDPSPKKGDPSPKKGDPSPQKGDPSPKKATSPRNKRDPSPKKNETQSGGKNSKRESKSRVKREEKQEVVVTPGSPRKSRRYSVNMEEPEDVLD